MSGRTRAAAKTATACSTVTFQASEQCAFLLGMIRNVAKLIERVYIMEVPIVVQAEASANMTITITDDGLVRYLYKVAFHADYPTGDPTTEERENINAIREILKLPLI